MIDYSTVYPCKSINIEGKELSVYKIIVSDFKRELDDILVISRLLGKFIKYDDKTDHTFPCHVYSFRIDEKLAMLRLKTGRQKNLRSTLKEIVLQASNKKIHSKWEEIIKTNNITNYEIKSNFSNVEFSSEDPIAMIEILKVLKLSL